MLPFPNRRLGTDKPRTTQIAFIHIPFILPPSALGRPEIVSCAVPRPGRERSNPLDPTSAQSSGPQYLERFGEGLRAGKVEPAPQNTRPWKGPSSRHRLPVDRRGSRPYAWLAEAPCAGSNTGRQQASTCSKRQRAGLRPEMARRPCGNSRLPAQQTGELEAAVGARADACEPAPARLWWTCTSDCPPCWQPVSL